MRKRWIDIFRRTLRIKRTSNFVVITVFFTIAWSVLFIHVFGPRKQHSTIMDSAIKNNYTIYRKDDEVSITEMPQITNRKDNRGDADCQQKKPDLIMIGVPKCGTGSVRTFLNEHPDVAMEMNSEGVQFFNLRYMREWMWYISQMPCSVHGQLTAENSPQYFTSEEAPERLFKFNPKMKLIVTVRDPIKRLESEFVQMALGRPQFLSGKSVQENVINPETGEINDKKTLVSKSVYIKYLHKWLEYFSVDQIHIVDGDEFAKNPVKELNEIERFLGISDYFTKKHFAYVESRGFFCLQRQHHVECLEKGKGRTHPYIDPYLREKLKDFYSPYNEELYNTFGKRFNWT